MYTPVRNLCAPACEFASSLLADTDDDEELSEPDARTLIEHLNCCLEGSAKVLDVSDACIMHMRFGSQQRCYYLTDGDDSDEIFDRFECSRGALYETLEAFFVLCLGGELQVNYSSDRENASVRVAEGEAFFMDVAATHSLASACKEVKMLVLRCQLDTVLAHWGDRVTSSSALVYEKFCGVNFALYRLSCDGTVVRDLLLANRNVYDAPTCQDLGVVHLEQVLAQYQISNCPMPDHVPESPLRICERELAAEDSEAVFAGIRPRHAVSIALFPCKVYAVQIAYGVLFT